MKPTNFLRIALIDPITEEEDDFIGYLPKKHGERFVALFNRAATKRKNEYRIAVATKVASLKAK
jgi:hypothetical protein